MGRDIGWDSIAGRVWNCDRGISLVPTSGLECCIVVTNRKAGRRGSAGQSPSLGQVYLPRWDSEAGEQTKPG